MKKATHRHTNQLRFCTFSPDLARIGPPAPQLAVGAQEGPLRAGPPSVGRFWGHLPGPAYRALSAGRSPTRVPRQRLPLAAPRPPRPPEGASASRMAPGRRPGGGPGRRATAGSSWATVPESWPRPPGSRPKPSPQVWRRVPGGCTAPLENRPRPEGRPPPRRFAVFGLGYPKASRGPPPGRPSYRPWGPAWVLDPARRALVRASNFRKTLLYGAWEKPAHGPANRPRPWPGARDAYPSPRRRTEALLVALPPP